MASAIGRQADSLSAELRASACTFEFFQAVRLLEHFAGQAAREAGADPPAPLGGDGPPEQELLRLRSVVAQDFPAAEIQHLAERPPSDQPQPEFDLFISFFGLIGPHGVLPQHYSSLVAERSHSKHRDYALRDFFDLFTHRAAALFYRAWQKHRLPIVYERSAQLPPDRRREDPCTAALYAFIGHGTPGLRRRLTADDEALLFYAGHFADRRRSAVRLGQILSDYFELDARIQQFVGQWLYLERSDQTALAGPRARPANSSLGKTTVLGARVWDVQSRFRVQLGPLDYAGFVKMMPTGSRLRQLADLTRLYVGREFDFDVQVILRKDCVPNCVLGRKGARAPRLGWNTWLVTQPPQVDAADPIFRFLND